MCCDGEVKQHGYCQGEARVQSEPETADTLPSVCDDHKCVNGDCVVFAGTVSSCECIDF